MFPSYTYKAIKLMKDGYFFEMAFQGFTFGHNNNDSGIPSIQMNTVFALKYFMAKGFFFYAKMVYFS